MLSILTKRLHFLQIISEAIGALGEKWPEEKVDAHPSQIACYGG